MYEYLHIFTYIVLKMQESRRKILEGAAAKRQMEVSIKCQF